MTEEKFIPARSRRQAREWGLVLLSQGIAATIEEHPELGWGLQVTAAEESHARHQLEQYEVENRGWRWRQPVAAGGLWFHAGAAAWSILLLVIHWLPSALSLYQSGVMDSRRVALGEWWRLFTACFLHGDVAHLMANAVTGFILLGLAMARYGAGCALLLTLLSGAFANGLGFLIYTAPHRGLGASAVVMAALGMMAVPWPQPGRGVSVFPSPLPVIGGGFLLFVLLGTDPSTDVLAHAGGFIGGFGFGLLTQSFAKKRSSTGWPDRIMLLLWGLLTVTVWVAALLRKPSL